MLVGLKAQKILDFDYSTAMIWLLKVIHRPHLQQFYLGMTLKKTNTEKQIDGASLGDKYLQSNKWSTNVSLQQI